MSQITALLDANVLYSAAMRDLMMQLAIERLYQARWTTAIHHEWIEALLRNEPTMERSALERTSTLMNGAVKDALITGYEELIDTLNLPDEHDRHVLAAAIVGECSVIVTQNLSDFPAATLKAYGIEAQPPDVFLVARLNADSETFCAAVSKIRTRLKHPPYSVADYLATLTRVGLMKTATALEPFTEHI